MWCGESELLARGTALYLIIAVAHSHSHSQIKLGVRTAMAWVTESLTAPNWLPFRTGRQQALGARTTSLPQQPTINTLTLPYQLVHLPPCSPYKHCLRNCMPGCAVTHSDS